LVNAHAVRIVKALYDFAPLQQDDLAFRKGDKMKILRYDDASVHSTIFCHIACIAWLWPIATHGWRVSNCVLVKTVSRTKTDEPIKMPSGGRADSRGVS